MPSYKILVKFKKKDNYFDPSGYGDFGYQNSYYDQMDRNANNRKFGTKAVVCFTKKDAYLEIAHLLGISVNKAQKNYELRRRKEPYKGKKNVGEWVYDSDCVTYHDF